MTNTNDGFLIAEEDLKIRGPGEVLGKRQSGLPSFNIADLSYDGDLLEEAKIYLERAIDIHPTYKNAYLLRGNAAYYLFEFDHRI